MQQEIKDAIYAAYEAGHLMTLKEITQKFGCSIRTAHKARHALVAESLIPAEAVSPGGRPPKERTIRGLGGAKSQITDDTISHLLAGDQVPLSTEQQRQILSGLILKSPNDAIKVAAQNALTRLDAQAGSALSVGPSAPLSDEGRIERLAMLMKACGLVIVKKSLQSAFPSAYKRFESLAETLPPPERLDEQRAETPSS